MKFRVELWRSDCLGHGFFPIGTYSSLEDAMTVAESIRDCAEAAEEKERFKIEIRGLEEISVGLQEEEK